MLRVDVRELARGPYRTDGEVPGDDPAFAGLDAPLQGPVSIRGTLQETVDGSYLWHGTLAGALVGICRRCLTEVVTPFQTEVRAVFSADTEVESDPSVYPLPTPVLAIDLGEAVREEVGLAVPPFPLCREDCAGLCQRCGADLNAGPCGCPVLAEPG